MGTKIVTVKGAVSTDMNGSECEFEFEAEVPEELSGQALEDHLEDEAKSTAMEHVSWYYNVFCENGEPA